MGNVNEKNTAQSEANYTFRNLKSACVYGRLYFPKGKAPGFNLPPVTAPLCDAECKMVKGERKDGSSRVILEQPY